MAADSYLQVTDAHFESAQERRAQQGVSEGTARTGEETTYQNAEEIDRSWDLEGSASGRHKTRTCDLYGVNVAL
jgi:hypothetical protein